MKGTIAQHDISAIAAEEYVLNKVILINLINKFKLTKNGLQLLQKYRNHWPQPQQALNEATSYIFFVSVDHHKLF